MSESPFNFKEKIAILENAKVQLPKELANAGELFFQRNFDKAQWDGVPWAERKDSDNTHALLVASGKLRQAMQKTVKSANWSEIRWSVNDIKYAKWVNGGTDNMVAREFIGGGKELDEIVMKKIDQRVKRILNI